MTTLHDQENKHPSMLLARKGLDQAILLTVDPLHAFQEADTNRILAAMGVLPSWAASALSDDFDSFREALEHHYAFAGCLEMTGGEIDVFGAYHYPQDPTLYPLAEMTMNSETVYFYEYAIVGVVNRETGSQWLTRMD